MPARVPEIEGWQWDDGNIAELAKHGITPRIVEQVAQEGPRFRRNRKGRGAVKQMIGADFGGRFWVICITPVPHQPGIWRAITGWTAGPHEREWYRRSR